MENQHQSAAHAATPTRMVGDRILRKPDVRARTGLSESAIDRGSRDGSFPAAIPLVGRQVGWAESSVAAWIEDRKAAGVARAAAAGRAAAAVGGGGGVGVGVGAAP